VGRGAGAPASGPLDEEDDRVNVMVVALKAALLNEKVWWAWTCQGLCVWEFARQPLRKW
jgi:hypothetical protein